MQWFNAIRKRSQKANVTRLAFLLYEIFVLPKPKITYTEGWFAINTGDLLRRGGCGNAARPVL